MITTCYDKISFWYFTRFVGPSVALGPVNVQTKGSRLAPKTDFSPPQVLRRKPVATTTISDWPRSKGGVRASGVTPPPKKNQLNGSTQLNKKTRTITQLSNSIELITLTRLNSTTLHNASKHIPRHLLKIQSWRHAKPRGIVVDWLARRLNQLQHGSEMTPHRNHRDRSMWSIQVVFDSRILRAEVELVNCS